LCKILIGGGESPGRKTLPAGARRKQGKKLRKGALIIWSRRAVSTERVRRQELGKQIARKKERLLPRRVELQSTGSYHGMKRRASPEQKEEGGYQQEVKKNLDTHQLILAHEGNKI